MRAIYFVSFCFAALTVGAIAYASMLTHITDLISTSVPGAQADHTMTFKVAHTIPASGQIVIVPQAGKFDIASGFDYRDVDFAISHDEGLTYTERDLAALPDSTNDGVSVITGIGGSITITLNSTDGIVQGDYVRVVIGTIANVGSTGLNSITNPTLVGAYTMTFTTKDSIGNVIDTANTLDVIIAPIRLGTIAPIVAPLRFNGLPSGTLAAGSRNIELSLETNIPSTCRYATTTNVLYDDMTGIFSSPNSLFFLAVEHGFLDDNTYSFYVRCQATLSRTKNDDDYPITFTLKAPPSSNTSVVEPGEISPDSFGYLGPGGPGSVPNGARNLFLGTVTLSGWTAPGSAVSLLQDGVKAVTTQSKSDGTFKATIIDIQRGSYDFSASFTDPAGTVSSLYTAALFVGQGTQNDIANIVLPPTLKLSSDSIQSGDSLTISGYASPESTISISIEGQGSLGSSALHTYSATTTPTGSWRKEIDTASFAKGMYAVEARASREGGAKSGLSKLATLGVGISISGSCGKPDMNDDGKVNLVDFSIFLLSWQTTEASADYNCDGQVNLADFSIMLFNWTG